MKKKLANTPITTSHSSRFGCVGAVAFLVVIGVLSSYPKFVPIPLAGGMILYWWPSLRFSRKKQVNYERGFVLHETEQYQDAIPLLVAYYHDNPKDYMARLILADCYFQSNECKKAIPLLQGIPEKFSEYYKAVELLGACFYQLGNTELAIATYEHVIIGKRKLPKKAIEIVYNLGQLYEWSGHSKKALSFYQVVAKHDRKYRDVQECVNRLSNRKQS